MMCCRFWAEADKSMSQGASLPPRRSAKECNQALLTAAVPSYFPPLDKWTDNEFLRLFSQCYAVLDRCALAFSKGPPAAIPKRWRSGRRRRLLGSLGR